MPDRHTIPIPPRLAGRPRNPAGYVVPWFAAEVEPDVWDFRVIRPGGLVEAIKFARCWICGSTVGRTVAFVVGPMCAVNRVSSEPPSHVECAEYAAQVCPFLVNPKMERRENRLPDGTSEPAGQMIRRNPGVALVWKTRSWSTFRVHNGVLIDMGEPLDVQWWAEGRPATRSEVDASIASGLPVLQEAARQDGPRGLMMLERAVASAVPLLPPSTTTVRLVDTDTPEAPTAAQVASGVDITPYLQDGGS